jgi:DNA-binding NtrC family response regulator
LLFASTPLKSLTVADFLMPLTLISGEKLPLAEIQDSLVKEGVPAAAVSSSRLDEFLATTDDAVINSDLFVLISTRSDLIETGEMIASIRNRLNSTQQLVVCMARPLDYQAVFDQGANEIIRPVTSSTAHLVERILGHLILTKKYIERHSYGSLFGATRLMQTVYSRIDACAIRRKRVLLMGETGTGKELVSQALHAKTNSTGSFVEINCAEIPEELGERILFGSRIGAYTGATNSSGLIQDAQNGSAFFDEIGDLPLRLQAKLLKVLDINKVRPVGASNFITVNARFVFATHLDLEKGIQDGKFRPDLFERIDGLDISLPPLRERKADLPLLVDHFIDKENREYHLGVKLGPGAVDELFHHEWRHNVRELVNVVDRAIAAAGENGTITDVMMKTSIHKAKHSSSEQQTDGQSAKVFSFDPLVDTWAEARDRLDAHYLRILWNETKGNKDEIIRLSGRRRSQVFAKLKEYGISKSNDPNTTN